MENVNNKVVFTSIVKNYLSKAIVLARSLKKVEPDIEFHVLISDVDEMIPTEHINIFDKIIYITEFKELNIPDWLFMHNLVELCTAIKPFYLKRLLSEGYDNVLYLDPDMMVFNNLNGIYYYLEYYDICLTPHTLEPDDTFESILDNELSVAKHGLYNMGFFAVRQSEQGVKFANWWKERMFEFCYSQTFMGCFTDQKVCDLVPIFFENVKVIKDEQYNVASWNIIHRTLSKEFDVYMVNGHPLVIYHFSSFDSGAGKMMIDKYSQRNICLNEIWSIYSDELKKVNDENYSKLEWSLGKFSNQIKITNEMRIYYRQNSALRKRYKNPYQISKDCFFYYWNKSSNVKKFCKKLNEFDNTLKTFKFPNYLAPEGKWKKLLNDIDFFGVSRVFVYGANDIAEQAINSLISLDRNDFEIFLIDRYHIDICEYSSRPIDDLTFLPSDLVIICGVKSYEFMLDNVKSNSQGHGPKIL